MSKVIKPMFPYQEIQLVMQKALAGKKLRTAELLAVAEFVSKTVNAKVSLIRVQADTRVTNAQIGAYKEVSK